MKRLWWSVGIVCVLVVVGFLAFAVMQVRQVSRWFHYQQASPTVRITSRSYSEPSDNGFSNLAAAAAELKPDRYAVSDMHALPWDEAQEDVPRLLDAAAERLHRAREAMARDCMQPSMQSYAETHPHLADFRGLTRLLAVESRARERAGRFDEAGQSYSDALGLGAVAARNGGMIHVLVDCAIVDIVFPDLSRCVGSGGMTTGGLTAVAEVVEGPPRFRSLSRTPGPRSGTSPSRI